MTAILFFSSAARAMPIGGLYDLGPGDRLVTGEATWIGRTILDAGKKEHIQEKIALASFIYGLNDRLTVSAGAGWMGFEINPVGTASVTRRMPEEGSLYGRFGVQALLFRGSGYWEGMSLAADIRGAGASGFEAAETDLDFTEWQVGLLVRKDHAANMTLTAGGYWSDIRMRGILAGSAANLHPRTHLTGVVAAGMPIRGPYSWTLEGRFGAEGGVSLFLMRAF